MITVGLFPVKHQQQRYAQSSRQPPHPRSAQPLSIRGTPHSQPTPGLVCSGGPHGPREGLPQLLPRHLGNVIADPECVGAEFIMMLSAGILPSTQEPKLI